MVYGIIMMLIAYFLPRFKGGKRSCIMNALGRAAARVGVTKIKVGPTELEAKKMEDTRNYLTEGGLPYKKGSFAWKINNYYAVESNIYAWFMVLIGALIAIAVILGIIFHQIFGESTTDSWIAGYLFMPSFRYSQIVFKTIGWEPLSDIGTFLGAFFTAVLVTKRFTAFKPVIPPSWRNRFGNSWTKRALGSFIGAYLMLFGARMADGCASGHILSGWLQMADSGLLFGIMVLLFAIITARLLYGNTPSEMSYRGTVDEKATEEWVAKLDKNYKYIAAAMVIGVIATVLVAAFATGFSTTYAIPPNAVALTAIIPILLLLAITAYYSQTPMTVDGQVVQNYEPLQTAQESK
ncbi:YeeE/YedE thiosulfate transporter family protein [Vulcanisaeta distributa]|uniref:YeeE/YedE thiosulfate transporter family protein n=1 Tax=Vulcanisaeta distributa TaxID=164451 RepID=UPI000AD14DC0|nr:YeeE/YedE thiosulfate transporter family protein [Vulcanisaeta distributa]